MKSRIFYTQGYKDVENKIKVFLNEYPDFLSESTISSPRATGDAIENILEQNFESVIAGFCKEYSAAFARRAMADLAFTDLQDLYYVVDVKTHRLETVFNMPNLTSVERLARFYESDANYFVVLIVEYKVVSDMRIQVTEVHFVPIEFLSWECLTIGALGWGQIQIANANNIIVRHGYSRKGWMLDLCNVLFEYYPREINKAQERIEYFNRVKKRWEEKVDIWK